MKKLVLLVVLCFQLGVRPVFGAELAQTTIRLSRMQAGVSPLPVLVMVKTNSVAVENGFQLTVGSAWQVSTVQISTANLPSGVIAWPGLAVNSVSGNTVNFDSSDLEANVTYGFYLTNGVANNPVAGDGAGYKWTAATLVGGSIDSEQEVKVPIIADDSIQITGKVAPNASDYSLAISSSSQGVLNQNQEIGYTITYASAAPIATKPVVVTATWDRGAVDSQPGLLVDVADYVLGSATTAADGNEPVIDLLNRTITWTITSLPANSGDQYLEFKLKTNEVFTSSDTVHFGVSAQLTAARQATITSNQITEQYQYFSIFTPTPLPSIVPTAVISLTPTPTVAAASPTPTTAPAQTSTASPTATPTPVPMAEVTPLAFTGLEMATLSADTLVLRVSLTGKPGSLAIVYGTTQTNLNKKVAVLIPERINEITLEGLKAETKYYFRIMADGIESDLFTFSTPPPSNIDHIINEVQLTVIGENNILLQGAGVGGTPGQSAVIPVNQTYSVTVKLPDTKTIKLMQIRVRNRQVLGIVDAYEGDPNSAVSDLFEISPGVYTAHLTSPAAPGWYEFYLRIYDFQGGIKEEKIGEMRVVPGMRVADAKGRGIEGARVIIYHQNEATQLYELVPANANQPNPTYSESDGRVLLILPEGTYKAITEAIGFKQTETVFVVDSRAVAVYPSITLISSPVGIGILTRFYMAATGDVVAYLGRSLAELGRSYRFFDWLSLLVVMMLLVVTWGAFGYKFRMPGWLLLGYGVYGLYHRLGKKGVVGGTVLDGKGYPVSGAKVFVIDTKGDVVVRKTASNIFGKFYFFLPKQGTNFKLSVISRGFEPSPLLDYTRMGLAAGNLRVRLEPSQEGKILLTIGDRIGMVLGHFFEVLLATCFIAELAIGAVNGWFKIMPMFSLSVINYWIWVRLEHDG